MGKLEQAVEALDALRGVEVFVLVGMNERPAMIVMGVLGRNDAETAPHIPPDAGDVAVYTVEIEAAPTVMLHVYAEALVSVEASETVGGRIDGAPVVVLVYGDGFSVRVARVDGGEI